MSNPNCPLCDSSCAHHFHADEVRPFYRCTLCKLVFVPAEQHLPPEEERKRYDLHQNDPGDPDYRAFLSRLADPLVKRLQPGERGLDFGCGPGPTLSLMMTERGFPTEHYDPLYANDSRLLERTYDFVTCTEVVEHFRNPAQDWERMIGLVRRCGYLAVMTQLLDTCDDFARWHYRRDDTHICFYARETLKWIAGRYEMRPAFIGESVVLFNAR